MAGQIKKITVNGETYEIGGGISAPISTTYSELKSLKESNQLVVGQKYRITDFVSVFDEAGITSANHPFDLVIEAISENLFSETACAIIHSGDDYFSEQKLYAWEVRYCFDNDTERFPQASSSGKGFIYYLKDEYGNEACYDFKNALFELSNTIYDFLTTTINAYTFSTYVSDMSDILDASLGKNKLTVRNNKVLSFKRTVIILPQPTLLRGSVYYNELNSTSSEGIVLYTPYSKAPISGSNNIRGSVYINSSTVPCNKFNIESAGFFKIKYANRTSIGNPLKIKIPFNVNVELTFNSYVEGSDITIRDEAKIIFNLSAENAKIDILGGEETEHTISEKLDEKIVRINQDGTYKAIDLFA